MSAEEWSLADEIWWISTDRSRYYKLVNGPKFRASRQGYSAQETYIIKSNYYSEDRDVCGAVPCTSYGVEDFLFRAFPKPYRASQIQAKATVPWLFIHQDAIEKNFKPRPLPGTNEEFRTTQVKITPLSPTMPADPLSADKGYTKDIPYDGLDEECWNGTYQNYYKVIVDYDTQHTDMSHEITGSGRFLSVNPHYTRTSDLDAEEEEEWTLEDSVVNKDVPMQIKKLRQVTQHTLKWPLVFAPRFSEINKHLGKVNSKYMEVINADAHTALFTGYSARKLETYAYTENELVDADNPHVEWPRYELSLQFSVLATEEDENIYGWNFVYSETHGKFIYVTTGTEKDDERRTRPANTPLYQKYDFGNALVDFPGVRDFLLGARER